MSKRRWQILGKADRWLAIECWDADMAIRADNPEELRIILANLMEYLQDGNIKEFETEGGEWDPEWTERWLRDERRRGSPPHTKEEPKGGVN